MKKNIAPNRATAIKPHIPDGAAVLRAIEATPTGLALADLLEQFPGISRRSAQRWLGQWVKQGHIAVLGQARATRYVHRLAITTGLAGTPQEVASFPHYIAISADSQDIAAYVDQPLSARKPVGYQADFLDTYEPNISAYLAPSLRLQLHNMGNTANAQAPAGTYSRAILNRLLIDLSWASSHLEGNTYSRLDTRALIDHGTRAQGKAALETQMILNHKNAIELLVQNIDTANFDRYTLMNLHSALAENLLPNPADEGRLRQHAVEISQSVYRPLSVPQQIEQQFDVLLTKAQAIADPFEQSFFMLVHLPYLQAFADINKRTSRLAANLPLFKANLCPLTFVDVTEQAYSRAILGVYELSRVELLRDVYVWAYERSTQEYMAIKQDLAQPDPTRLAYRDAIKQTVRDVVLGSNTDVLAAVSASVAAQVPMAERSNVQALILDELRRLHEGVLARYGLRPSEFKAWQGKRVR